QVAAESACDLAADREAEPLAAGVALLQAGELLEDVLPLVRRDSRPGILHVHGVPDARPWRSGARSLGGADRDAPALRRVLDRVREQVAQDLPHAGGVRVRGRLWPGDLHVERNPPALGLRTEALRHLGHDAVQLHVTRLDGKLPGLRARQ